MNVDLNSLFDRLLTLAPWLIAPLAGYITLHILVLGPWIKDRRAERKEVREQQERIAKDTRDYDTLSAAASYKRRMDELAVQKAVNETMTLTTANLAMVSTKCNETMATAERMQESGVSAMRLAERFVNKLQGLSDGLTKLVNEKD